MDQEAIAHYKKVTLEVENDEIVADLMSKLRRQNLIRINRRLTVKRIGRPEGIERKGPGMRDINKYGLIGDAAEGSALMFAPPA